VPPAAESKPEWEICHLSRRVSPLARSRGGVTYRDYTRRRASLDDPRRRVQRRRAGPDDEEKLADFVSVSGLEGTDLA
jgi:hypothetical protein